MREVIQASELDEEENETTRITIITIKTKATIDAIMIFFF